MLVAGGSLGIVQGTPHEPAETSWRRRAPTSATCVFRPLRCDGRSTLLEQDFWERRRHVGGVRVPHSVPRGGDLNKESRVVREADTRGTRAKNDQHDKLRGRGRAGDVRGTHRGEREQCRHTSRSPTLPLDACAPCLRSRIEALLNGFKVDAQTSAERIRIGGWLPAVRSDGSLDVLG